MRIFKAHGLGNDYLAVEGGAGGFQASSVAVRLLCDRRRGLGADGLLVRVPAKGGGFGIRIFNPDGSEAEKSGNGLRIFAAYLYERGEVEVGQAFEVETISGPVTLTILEASGAASMVEVAMGRASFLSSEVGLAGPDREVVGELLELANGARVPIHTVSVGNPHCVVFDDELRPEDFETSAPQISRHPDFTGGVNVQFARAIDPATVEARIWERGAGETLASGSSACAVAAVAVRTGLVSSRTVEVRMPGGSLEVVVGEDWQLVLRGPVESVYQAEPLGGFLAELERATVG